MFEHDGRLLVVLHCFMGIALGQSALFYSCWTVVVHGVQWSMAVVVVLAASVVVAMSVVGRMIASEAVGHCQSAVYSLCWTVVRLSAMVDWCWSYDRVRGNRPSLLFVVKDGSVRVQWSIGVGVGEDRRVRE